MNPLYDTQDFYKKMLQLQERLRKSEDERMKLEERFNLLSQDFRNRRETCINNLRMRYIDFLEEQRLRDERNQQILGALDKIDGSLARMTARTDRLGILRKQYEAYLLRVYANRNTEGGTGDSGVGSHNEDRSPKTNISPIGKNLPQTQRMATQHAGNPLSFIPQTKHPRSYIGAPDISQFNLPRYTPGQETPQGHVMPAYGMGNASDIVQPQRMSQLFYDSQNRDIPNTSIPKTHLMPNTSQEFISSNRSYPQQFSAEQFLRSNNQTAPNYAQVPHHQLHDISNQYLVNRRPPYAGEPSMVRSQKLPDSQGMISSDLPSSLGLQFDTPNGKAMSNFSSGLGDEPFNPYRQSTPLPGYLDYLTRYSRDPSVHDPNAALRHEFMRSNLEKVVDRKEHILPKDYLHNSETVEPAVDSSKLSSRLENKQRLSDTRPSRGLNDDGLDQYISRIRSLHRDNDQSLEALDIEQNTSGDLLNATLSDDGPELLTLHSSDKTKPNEDKIVSDEVKNVLALADDFVAETGKLGDRSQLYNDSSKDRKIPSKSVFSPKKCNDNVVAKLKSTEIDDGTPAALKSDMTSDNLSISVTRNDILSGTASVGANHMQDTSAVANGKFRPKITPPIADVDTSRLNLTDVAPLSENNLVNPEEFRPNESDGHPVLRSSSQEYPKMLEKRINLDRKANSGQRMPTEVPNGCTQSVTKDYSFMPKETDVHEDIEGDKVSLIEGEQIPEKVIDVIKELQPPRLQHYEKNIVEVREGDESKKDGYTRKVTTDGVAGPKIQGTADTALRKNPGAGNVAETLSQDSIANKIYTERDVTDQKYTGAEQTEEQILNSSNKDVSKHAQRQNDIEPKYELSPDQEYPPYEQKVGENLAQDADMDHTFEHDPEQLYDTGTIEKVDYDTKLIDDKSNRMVQPDVADSDEPYNANQSYDANRQYETDPSQQYMEESNPQFAYNSNPHFEDDPNRQYGAISNEQYGNDPNEQYTVDPNEQYLTDPNEQYAADPNEQYAADPNEQYAADPNAQYAADPNEQYAVNPNEQYAADPNEQYAVNRNEQYAADPNEQYAVDPNEQYAVDPNAQYTSDPNEQYVVDSNEQYRIDPNEQYANGTNEQYAADPNEQYSNEHYETDPNAGYTADPNEQYDYYQNQPYPDDQNRTGENMGNEQYDYAADQGYQHDPNQHFEHDLNQPYEHDPNEQYEHDNESSVQDLNQEYKESEYGQNQSSEYVDYEVPQQSGNQGFENNPQQNYAGLDSELQSSNRDYPTATTGDHNEMQAAIGDSHVRDLSDPDDIGVEESSADEKMRKKDVIRALLESDTESTIERDPSNNTESDFNFN